MEKRLYFMKTRRIGFSRWTAGDLALAESLWTEPEVTRFICASGRFSKADAAARLDREIENQESFGLQYWPIFRLEDGRFIGCCGLRPHGEAELEIGFHLKPEFWGQGLAAEAAKTVIQYAFRDLKARRLFAGHHPDNLASQKLLGRLGFVFVGTEFYGPTGLQHPSYVLKHPY